MGNSSDNCGQQSRKDCLVSSGHSPCREKTEPEEMKQIINENTSKLYATDEINISLFQNTLDGFALHEKIFDDFGRSVDFRFLAMNPSFEKITGIAAEKAVGKKMCELLPYVELFWVDLYDTILASEIQTTFSGFSTAFSKYFEIAFFSTFNQFSCIFRDITERVLAEKKTTKLEYQLRRTSQIETIGTLCWKYRPRS